MRKAGILLFFILNSLVLSEVARAQFGKARESRDYSINNTFIDQFNHVDWINFWIYDFKDTGWREFYLNPFNGFNRASVANAWGTYFFPYEDGGMTYRWNANASMGKTPTISSLDWEKIKKMGVDERNRLSPCEKADIYFGNKDFRITKHEMYWRGKERGKGETQSILLSTVGHEGFCNGARAAGALTPEPVRSIRLASLVDTNIKVTFFPLDIKMLATLSYFHIDFYKVAMIGGVENGGKLFVNPATFDVALRSIIGTRASTFFMDVDRSSGIATNVSVIGYERQTKIVDLNPEEKSQYPSAFNKCTVTVKVFLLGEVPPSDAVNPTESDIKSHTRFTFNKTCSYSLILEKATSKILDGIWDSSSFVPNNIWFASGLGCDEVFVYKSPIASKLPWDDQREPRLGNPYLPGIFVHNLINRSAIH